MTTTVDKKLRDEIVARLRWDEQLREGGIQVAVHDRVVSLDGRVASDLERSRAQVAAVSVRGVRSVINLLRVSA